MTAFTPADKARMEPERYAYIWGGDEAGLWEMTADGKRYLRQIVAARELTSTQEAWLIGASQSELASFARSAR